MRNTFVSRSFGAVIAAGFAVCAPATTQAQEFYKGKNVTVILPSSASQPQCRLQRGERTGEQ